MTPTEPPPPASAQLLQPAEVARLLDAHMCSMNEHPPITEPGFDDALRVHLWSLPEGAPLRAITYIQVHRRPGFVTTLVTDLHTRNLTAQSFVAAALGKLPDAPSPEATWAVAKALPNPNIRAVMARTLDALSPPERVLATARDARAHESDAPTLRMLLLVAAKRGDPDAMRTLAALFEKPDAEDLRPLLRDLGALAPAPALAPLLRTWLDDKRALGTSSHFERERFVVADHAVWTIQTLGVPLDPPLTRLTHVDAKALRRAKAALARAPASRAP